MKLEKLIVENEAGETGELNRADYIKHVVKSQEVKAFESEETGSTPADKVVTHILKSLENGTDVDPNIASEYKDLIEVMTADVDRTSGAKANKKAEAEAAKAAKEAEKAKREAEEKAKAEQLALTQKEFVEKLAEGADLAVEEYKEDIAQMIKALPEGATVVRSGSGFGIEFDSTATKETIGQTLGYVSQKADNSTFLGNQLHFWVGDIIGAAVARGFFITAKEAAKYIATTMSEKTGKVIEPQSLDQYKRMAERTPIEFRNPKADPTAYLALSAMKEPKKGDKEEPAAFEKRKAAFEEDRASVQKQLATGELSKRKEVMPIVNDLLVKHGMREAVDPNAPVISTGQQLAIFFHTSFALENLLGAIKEDLVIYKDGENLIEVTKEQLEEQRSIALGHLTNILYTNEKAGLKPADFIRGYVMKTVKVKVADGQDGKPIMEDQNVKNFVYPAPFFSVEKAEETPAAPAAPAAEVKKAKK